MALKVLPAAVGLECAVGVRAAVRAESLQNVSLADGKEGIVVAYLMRPLMLTQITAIRTRKVAKPALMRFLPLVQRAYVRLQLRMRRCRVSAPVTHVRPLACMCALMVILGLVCSERLVAAGIAACVWSVTRMSK